MLPPKLALFGGRRVNISTVLLQYNYGALKLLGFSNGTQVPSQEPAAPLARSVLVTFLVVILVLYLINMLPLDGRAKQIARVVVIILGVISLLKYIAVF
jgi:hypothetical protein